MQRRVQVQALRVSVLEGDAEGYPQGMSKGRVLIGRRRGTKWIRRKKRILLRRQTEINICIPSFLSFSPLPASHPSRSSQSTRLGSLKHSFKAAPSSDSLTRLHMSIFASSLRLWASSDLNPQTNVICGVEVTTEALFLFHASLHFRRWLNSFFRWAPTAGPQPPDSLFWIPHLTGFSFLLLTFWAWVYIS